jgi:hypothetical protein
MTSRFIAAAAVFACGFGTAWAKTAWVVIANDSPQVHVAAKALDAALQERGYAVEAVRHGDPVGADGVVIRFWPNAAHPDMPALLGRHAPRPPVAAEGFRLRVDRTGGLTRFHIVSQGTAGAMYGAFELAEQIRTAGVDGVADEDVDPHMPMRGVKFNIPLDLRTPSYSDMSDAGQRNIETVWDFHFWREYLDRLARHRYNFVSLWNLHPFPSMVKVPEFPQVALDDVWRSNVAFAEDYSTRTTDLVTPAMLADKTVVRNLTIAQKIAFWRQVMQYAHDRNIDFYVVTWNVYTYGVDGKYGITDSIENPKTRDYFRASVREMFRTYPLLRGIGLTAGENMGEVKMYSGGVDSFDAKERWLFDTYGQGVLDAARAEPDRRFRLIHRQHESRAQDIVATFGPVIDQPNVEFDFSFKYAQAHALSSTTQTFHHGFLESLRGDQKTLWTLRNDDALLLRWAAPGFVREFIANIPREKTRGVYYGSDNWIPGRDFLTNHPPRLKGGLEIDKHWLHTLLWGRIAYDPTLDDARIAALIGLRFPGVDGAKLLDAWQNASMIYPLVTGFHWADFDFQWYIEGCRSRPGPAKTETGFHSVETFIGQKVHPGTDNVPIPAYVAAIRKGIVPRGTTPFEVADALDARTTAAHAAILALNRAPAIGGAEYSATLNDIALMTALGRYYAQKIRGATELALYRETGKPIHQRRALAHLGRAAESASVYAARASAHYGPRFWTNRVGHVDFDEFADGARRDLDIARAPLEQAFRARQPEQPERN